jgi:CheY-like chemotaxis protein
MTDTNQKLVLIIEDQTAIADVVSAALEGLGLVPHHVLNANAALEFLESNRPDLIVLDIGLPGMSGWELLEIIQAWRKDAHIPILVTTAFADPANRLVGKLQDVDYYLQKPFEVAALQETAIRLLGLAAG